MQQGPCPYRQLQEQIEEFVPREGPSLKRGKHTHTRYCGSSEPSLCRCETRNGAPRRGARAPGARKSRLTKACVLAETNLARDKFQPVFVNLNRTTAQLQGYVSIMVRAFANASYRLVLHQA